MYYATVTMALDDAGEQNGDREMLSVCARFVSIMWYIAFTLEGGTRKATIQHTQDIW